MAEDTNWANAVPVIYGCAGTALTPDEKTFFEGANPFGFILFERNCDSPDQVRDLIGSMRECVNRSDAPVLIDQEGGRVTRLKPPHWRLAPAPARFVEHATEHPEQARQAARLNARLMAEELLTLGITVNCTPVLDIPQPDADPIIGDRALGHEPELVASLGRAVCEGFLEGGVLPVIKHIPGHGRATADSHKSLPVVDTDLAELRAVDFAPFQALNDMPWAMTAHVLYSALDMEAPATTSKKVIDSIIRKEIGYQGVLISDDLSMQALSGDFEERTVASLEAGCDLVLHCNGDLTEMEAIHKACDAVCATLKPETKVRLKKAERSRMKPAAFDREETLSKLNELMGASS